MNKETNIGFLGYLEILSDLIILEAGSKGDLYYLQPYKFPFSIAGSWIRSVLAAMDHNHNIDR